MSPTVSCFVGLLAGIDFKWHGYNSHSSLTGNHNSPLEGWAKRDGTKAANSSAVAETGSGLDVGTIPEIADQRFDCPAFLVPQKPARQIAAIPT